MKDFALLVNSDDMMMTVKETLEHIGGDDIEVIETHGYEETAQLAQSFARRGCRAIIARGGHARYLREIGLMLPIVSIPFTGNNIVSMLVQATNEWGEFAVLGNPTMMQMTRELERPIGAKIHYYEVVRWADFDEIMPRIRNAGIKAVVGGYDTARAARAYGLHDYCIKTSEYEIASAIMETRSMLAAMEKDRQWDMLFRSAMDSIGEGVLVVDESGAVSHANSRAVKLLGSGESLPDPDMLRLCRTARSSGKAIYDELYEYNGYKFSASFLPLEEDRDHTVVTLQEVEYVHKMERQIRQKLANKGLVAKSSFGDIQTSSRKLQEAVRMAKQYALVDSTVLIHGETGTGKELFAQSIHNFSRRCDEAFVAVNCATIPANLLESELFGYVEGAFTGAKRGGKVGLFELAHKGTIFLDEIGETSLDMQARLLRVMEEREIMRVGDDKVIPVDIRVIAASNRDLQKMVDEGSFRSDFYYRMDVLPLRLPPLRESKENIRPLIRSFADRYAARHGKRDPEFTESGIAVFENYDWPGNVRELKNVIERLIVTNSTGVIDEAAAIEALHLRSPKQLKPAAETKKPATSGDGLIDAAERELILRVLSECGGNKSAAAIKLGISRPTLHRKLKLIEGADE